MKRYIVTFLLGTIMIGCGVENKESAIGTGYYKDSAVSGVRYVCGSQQGVTDALGKFSFEKNQGCTFSINNVPFKSVVASKLLDGVTIQETNIEIARFLQILDNDANPDNGITILDEVAQKVTSRPTDEMAYLSFVEMLKKVPAYKGDMISQVQAQTHLDKSIAKIVAKATVSSAFVKQGEVVTLMASASTISHGAITGYLWSENGITLSEDESFSKNNFSLGNHTVMLTVVDAKGVEARDSVSFLVQTPVNEARWIGKSALSSNANNHLFVTSDESNIYLRLKANSALSDDTIKMVQFYINADDSNLTGLRSGIWLGQYFEYVVKNDGIYHLLGAQDYTGPKVQDMHYNIENKTIDVTIEKSNIAALAPAMAVSVFFPTNVAQSVPKGPAIAKFTDTHFVQIADAVAPIITLTGVKLQQIQVGDSYVELGASAVDVVDGVIDTVSIDTSLVDTSKSGFYNVMYTAVDAAGNTAKLARIVEVTGASSQTSFEKKNLGALEESVIINHQTKQVWANDNTDSVNEGNTRGCMVVGGGATGLKTLLNNYCKNSNYAGFTDWRAPTSLELSKYTIQMWQERKTPGMARKGCVRTLAIDNNTTVKTVWTHILNQAGRIDAENLTPAGGRCVRGPVDTQSGEFTILDGIMIDTQKHLMWVSENNVSTEACMAVHKVIDNNGTLQYTQEYNTSKGFCEALDFANHADWRDPLPTELENFIKKTNAAHILPGYLAPCRALLARERDVSGNITSEWSISTRFAIGTAVGTKSTLAVPLVENIGLRCVRDN